MRRFLTVLTVIAAAGCLPATDPVKDKETDETRIQGTWQLVGFDLGGARGGPKPEEISTMKMVVADGKIAVYRGDKKEMNAPTYKLDSTTKPKSIDVTEYDKVKPGIYELDGDTLKLCVPEGDKPTRPTEMKANAEKFVAVMTFKRVKDEKKDK